MHSDVPTLNVKPLVWLVSVNFVTSIHYSVHNCLEVSSHAKWAAMDLNDEVDDFSSALFQEPVGYFPPEPAPTYTEYTLLSGQTIPLRLVGHNPLWVSTSEASSPTPRAV